MMQNLYMHAPIPISWFIICFTRQIVNFHQVISFYRNNVPMYFVLLLCMILFYILMATHNWF